MRRWTRRGGRNRMAACCELSSLFWSMTFLSRLHSALFAWALSTWLISSTCSWVDGSCPEQERADKFSSVSSFPRPLLSPDTAYEVNFTLSSLILALISRCLCHILRPRGAPLPAGRARSLPRNAHHSRPFRYWSWPPSITICQNVAPL